MRRIEDFYHWTNEADTNWKFLSEARGDVAVPAGTRVRLVIGVDRWRDLSPLVKLEPDDIYSLSFTYTPPGAPAADDTCMPYIGSLTGLKTLALWLGTAVTDDGLKHIRHLRSLERLTLPKGISDKGLAYVAEISSLKGLYFKSNRVSDDGLALLEKLKNLEELELGGSHRGETGKAP